MDNGSQKDEQIRPPKMDNGFRKMNRHDPAKMVCVFIS
jgi:hypothetical protein